MIDLHLHTTASDGQYTPAQLVALTREAKLRVIAVTDHDTTDGVRPAQEAAQGWPRIIPGIELSAEDISQTGKTLDVHMLGYFVHIDHAPFQATIADFRARRLARAEQMVAKLADIGVPVLWERVQAIAGDAAIGRPHVARAMVEAGHVSTVREAFDQYLYNDGPAYVARARLSPEAAVQLIHEAGGAAVLAHPAIVPNYRAMIERLLPAGLDGVEVVHPLNDEHVRANLRGLAQQHNLIMTGGSDFHGGGVSSAMLGSVAAPANAVELLENRASQYSPS